MGGMEKLSKTIRQGQAAFPCLVELGVVISAEMLDRFKGHAEDLKAAKKEDKGVR